MVNNEGGSLKRVILCTPGDEYFNPGNKEEHNFKDIPDREEAVFQHKRLNREIENYGAKVYNVEELSGHPNSVFTRDASVCTSEGYIRLRMGLPSRRGEEDWLADELNLIGESELGSIKEPGTVEGGDVILAGKVAFVGLSGRSNSSGVNQIKRLLEKTGMKVRIIDVPSPFLHLGGGVSMVDRDKLIYCREIYDKDLFKGYRAIGVPFKNTISGNVINLGEGEVVADKNNLETIEILDKNDIKVISINLDEFIKGGGGPTCLIMPVKRG